MRRRADTTDHTLRTARLVPSCQRAIVHSKSDSRLRYGTTCDGGGAAARDCTSARRTTVRATSSHAATRFPPGTTNSVGGSNRAERASITVSSRVTIDGSTHVLPGSSLERFSGNVASSVINTHKSLIRGIKRDSTSDPAPASARTTPRTACASSTIPYALGSTLSFATRPP